MRNGLLGSIAALAAGAGLAQAQPAARLPAGPPLGSPAAAFMAGPGAAGVADAVPIGPSLVGHQAVMPTEPGGAFMGAMQPPGEYFGPPNGEGEPRLNAERGYFQADYMLGFIQSQPSNFPLVSVGVSTRFAAVGPGSTTLFGADNFRFNPISGGRFTGGLWWKRNPRIGIEASATVYEDRTERFIGGFGDQVVARPVIDATTGAPVSLLVAFPGFARGGVQVVANSQYWTMEYNGKLKLWQDENKEVSFLVGFRYADLFERLDIDQRTFPFSGITIPFFGLNFPAPNEVRVADTFQTKNQYFLTQIGLQGKWRYRRWTASASGKFGWGPVKQTLLIDGNSTIIVVPNTAATVVPGGLLATSSNIGRYHAYPWAVMPEGQMQLAYRMFRCTDLVVGYQISYFSQAIRPGRQIDAVVNPVYVPTSPFFGTPFGDPARPAATIRQSDFWIQGFNLGVHIHF